MSCCNKCLSSVPEICLIVFKIGLVIFNIGLDIRDKYVDIATAVEYHKGNLFHKPKESVYRALLAFTVIGGIISVVRIFLYVWRAYLNCTGSKGYDKCYDDFNLGTQSIKVVLEAFPQSAIAKFGFLHCPIKKYGWGVWFLDPAFDGFCGALFIYFICVIMSVLRIKCCGEGDEYQNLGRREWSEKDNVWTYCKTLFCSCFGSVLFIAVPLSVVGLIFASLSLSEFSKHCS